MVPVRNIYPGDLLFSLGLRLKQGLVHGLGIRPDTLSMLFKILKRKQRRQKLRWYAGCSWTPRWKAFAQENFIKLPQLLQALEGGLDEQSVRVLRTVLFRYLFSMPNSGGHWFVSEDSQTLYFDSESLLDEDVSYLSEKQHLKKKYPLAKDEYEISVFKYHSGLIFLHDLGVFNYLKGTVFVDGGGYIGDTALVFLEYQPKEIVIFEPDPRNHRLLKQTVAMNKVGIPLHLVESGLSDSESEGLLKQNYIGSTFCVDGQSQSQSNRDSLINTPLTSLDKWFLTAEKNGFASQRVGLIKLDVEGFEYAAIRGGMNLIKSHRPILLISIYHTPQDFFYIKPFLSDHLKNYQFMVRKLNPCHPTFETMLIAYPSELASTMTNSLNK
ncbi:MAG: FkbM family methyltransferase [Bdellovibrionaceae bacterium]|nr:FkbM family methyltransferase [Pseudobdellovibrionaceae bacterium]MDW8189522.1 FkbM family methyltransferase [Pseudobdellovibrionaceae bacterium]